MISIDTQVSMWVQICDSMYLEQELTGLFRCLDCGAFSQTDKWELKTQTNLALPIIQLCAA